jgi:hypothetical protein
MDFGLKSLGRAAHITERKFEMTALARLAHDWLGWGAKAESSAPPPRDPEPVYDSTRPVTGFFATLTAEQKAAALKYSGEDCYSAGEFKRS